MEKLIVKAKEMCVNDRTYFFWQTFECGTTFNGGANIKKVITNNGEILNLLTEAHKNLNKLLSDPTEELDEDDIIEINQSILINEELQQTMYLDDLMVLEVEVDYYSPSPVFVRKDQLFEVYRIFEKGE